MFATYFLLVIGRNGGYVRVAISALYFFDSRCQFGGVGNVVILVVYF